MNKERTITLRRWHFPEKRPEKPETVTIECEDGSTIRATHNEKTGTWEETRKEPVK